MMYQQADREADTPRRRWFDTDVLQNAASGGRKTVGGPCCGPKQAAHAAEVIVKITGPSAKIAVVMATMATAMATATAKPSRGVLEVFIVFYNIVRRHMHAASGLYVPEARRP